MQPYLSPQPLAHTHTQAQELVDKINEYWGPYLSARMKADYLLSDRDLNAMRIDFSFDLVKNIPRKKVRWEVYLVKPHSLTIPTADYIPAGAARERKAAVR